MTTLASNSNIYILEYKRPSPFDKMRDEIASECFMKVAIDFSNIGNRSVCEFIKSCFVLIFILWWINFPL